MKNGYAQIPQHPCSVCSDYIPVKFSLEFVVSDLPRLFNLIRLIFFKLFSHILDISKVLDSFNPPPKDTHWSGKHSTMIDWLRGRFYLPHFIIRLLNYLLITLLAISKSLLKWYIFCRPFKSTLKKKKCTVVLTSLFIPKWNVSSCLDFIMMADDGRADVKLMSSENNYIFAGNNYIFVENGPI